MVVKSDYPDAKTRERVKTLIGVGVPLTDVCALVVDPTTGTAMTMERLNALFADEIATASASANALVLAALYKHATGDGKEAVKAALHWVNTHPSPDSTASETKCAKHKPKLKLSRAVKERVVIMLAQGMFFAEIRDVLQDELGITVTSNSLQRYDPRTTMGQALSADLRKLFYETQAHAREALEELDYAYRPTRVRALEHELAKAQAKGDGPLVARLLAQIAAEMDGIELIDIGLPTAAPDGGSGSGGNTW